MSVEAYAAVIRSHCYRVKLTDAYMFERFVCGLCEPLFSYVAEKPPQPNFDEAVEVANTTESLENSRASRNVTVSNIRTPILQLAIITGTVYAMPSLLLLTACSQWSHRLTVIADARAQSAS